ncbi:MAG: DUF6883 domain-containing protein [Candidatus Binataceae bacterium]
MDVAKLRDYCLNPHHPRGRDKARVFASALRLTASHTEALCDARGRLSICRGAKHVKSSRPQSIGAW